MDDLADKAKLATERLNSIPDVKCNEVMGCKYAFPRILLPEKAVAKAEVYSFSAVASLKTEYIVFETWRLAKNNRPMLNILI